MEINKSAPVKESSKELTLEFWKASSGKPTARFRELGLSAYGDTYTEAFARLAKMLDYFCDSHLERGSLEKVLTNAGLLD